MPNSSESLNTSVDHSFWRLAHQAWGLLQNSLVTCDNIPLQHVNAVGDYCLWRLYAKFNDFVEDLAYSIAIFFDLQSVRKYYINLLWESLNYGLYEKTMAFLVQSTKPIYSNPAFTYRPSILIIGSLVIMTTKFVSYCILRPSWRLYMEAYHSKLRHCKASTRPPVNRP